MDRGSEDGLIRISKCCFVSGHDFSRAKKGPEIDWALQAVQKLILIANFKGFVTGPDFSRADKANQINVGL